MTVPAHPTLLGTTRSDFRRTVPAAPCPSHFQPTCCHPHCSTTFGVYPDVHPSPLPKDPRPGPEASFSYRFPPEGKHPPTRRAPSVLGVWGTVHSPYTCGTLVPGLSALDSGSMFVRRRLSKGVKGFLRLQDLNLGTTLCSRRRYPRYPDRTRVSDLPTHRSFTFGSDK